MIYSIYEFDYDIIKRFAIEKRRRGNQGTGSRIDYYSAVCAFDIETSKITLSPEQSRDLGLKDNRAQSIMYIWQFQIAEYTIVGRYWEQLYIFMERLAGMMPDGVYLCVFVHNLAYEFQFMRSQIPIDDGSVFAIDIRKPLRFTCFEHFEFRCSYLHSNMSLKEYMKKMKVSDEHQKLSGDEFNYDKIRYPWTPLTERELLYCVNDVRGLVQAIRNEMNFDGDSLYSFPLTSTGYVRRDSKRAMRQAFPRDLVQQIAPDWDLYVACREAFRGGNTHANRFYVRDTISNVHSVDRSSSYPDVQVNCKFPMSKFYHVGPCGLDRYSDLVNHGKAILMRIRMQGVRLKRWDYPCPYIATAKCRNAPNYIILNGERVRNYEDDNGRILCAHTIDLTVTDIDFDIILQQYDADDIQILDLWHARYGRLPQPLINTTIGYYRLKTELKGDPDQQVYYVKAKNKLNSIYGMMAQAPVRQPISYDTKNGDWIDPALTRIDLSQTYEATRYKFFLSYAWGVWVTAHARYRLQQLIDQVGDRFVYCDTDSVKYFGSADFTRYNRVRMKDSERNGAFADDAKGTRHYMGVAEIDGEYAAFKTLGAKKYVYRDHSDLWVCNHSRGSCRLYGHKYRYAVNINREKARVIPRIHYIRSSRGLHCTIAGVIKKDGALELAKHGGLAAFSEGFVFVDAGGTVLTYNDRHRYGSITRDGRPLEISSNVTISPDVYTLSIEGEYLRILERCPGSLRPTEMIY